MRFCARKFPPGNIFAPSSNNNSMGLLILGSDLEGDKGRVCEIHTGHVILVRRLGMDSAKIGKDGRSCGQGCVG